VDSYHLWHNTLLPDELESKLTLGGSGSGPIAGNRGSAPPTAPGSVVGGNEGPQTQPSGDLASLWGNAQVCACACVCGGLGVVVLRVCQQPRSRPSCRQPASAPFL
jgi:hypothetical protein